MVLKYANSGDVTGDRSRVVGYSADVFVKAPRRKGSGNAVLAECAARRANCSPWRASRWSMWRCEEEGV
jgi:hypothetical protein